MLAYYIVAVFDVIYVIKIKGPNGPLLKKISGYRPGSRPSEVYVNTTLLGRGGNDDMQSTVKGQWHKKV